MFTGGTIWILTHMEYGSFCGLPHVFLMTPATSCQSCPVSWPTKVIKASDCQTPYPPKSVGRLGLRTRKKVCKGVHTTEGYSYSQHPLFSGLLVVDGKYLISWSTS